MLKYIHSEDEEEDGMSRMKPSKQTIQSGSPGSRTLNESELEDYIASLNDNVN
jgi:hypothetical protein